MAFRVFLHVSGPESRTALGHYFNQEKEDMNEDRIDVLDDGFVILKDVMGTDADIAEAARVSYGNHGKTFSQEEDRTLIRYLMRHRHTSPLEQAELKFIVRVPMDCWRQWIRHRMSSTNEYSTRYKPAIDSMQKTPPDKWRLQASNNKQGSDGFLETTEDLRGGAGLSRQETEMHKIAKEVYQTRLDAGIAREQARKDLPLSTYTEAYWKIDLHNLLHFLSLRMDSHAQWEIRQYANAVSEFVKKLFPITWEAFEDYRLGAVTLTRLDVEVIKGVQENSWADPMLTLETLISNKREREECLEKLKTLSLL